MSQKASIDAIYPLSPMQQGMLFHSLSERESAVYFEQSCFTLASDLDASAFRSAWEHLVTQHGALRTAFSWKHQGEPLQIVFRQVNLPWREEDWRGLDEIAQEQRLAALLEKDRARGFNLARAPLTRIILIRRGPSRWTCVWSFHHLLLDGWSVQLLLNELGNAYNDLRAGRNPSPSHVRPYCDYIEWLRKQDSAKVEQFWRRTLQGVSAPTDIQALRTEGLGHASANWDLLETLDLRQDENLLLRTAARNLQLTLNSFVQAAWALLLSFYSGAQDVMFGATVSGRPVELQGSAAMIGLFINTLPVRVRLDRRSQIGKWLREIQAEQADARQYDHSSLAQVQRWSSVPRGTPLFHTLLVVENYSEVGPRKTGRLEIETANFFERTNYPITALAEFSFQLTLRIRCTDPGIQKLTVRQMLQEWKDLILYIASYPDRRLDEVPMFRPREFRQALPIGDPKPSEFAIEQCMHQKFEQRAAETPKATAVSFAAASATYEQLNRRANRWAHGLRRCGAAPEIFIGMFLPRSIDLVTAVLAILKSGAAYVPLDESYPAERLAFMLQQSGIRLVCSCSDIATKLPHVPGVRVINLDQEWEGSEEAETNLEHTAIPQNAAYLLYTSGSTGVPKGVVVEHRSLMNVLCWLQQTLEIGVQDTFLAITTLSFDIAAAEIHLPLIAGASLEIISTEMLREGKELVRLLEARHFTFLQGTPSTFTLLMEAGWADQRSMKIICCGEALTEGLAQRLAAGKRRVWNLYGPTEATVFATGSQVQFGEKPHIGGPIANTTAYILTPELEQVQPGIAGELYVGGVALARGYMGRPDLTAERFVPNPFSDDGSRLYRSGDLVKCRAEGEIDFLGRVDHQVKIRGYRIEMGEIEQVLARHPSVRQTCVVAVKHPGGNQAIVAYIVLQPFANEIAEQMIEHELREHAGRSLPGYMVPAAYIRLEQMPLTGNGKVDRGALPAPVWGVEESQREKPRNHREQVLVEIWVKVLGLEGVGVEENFFELGGDSILSIQIVSRALEAGLRITSRQVFQYPTIAELARVAEEVEEGREVEKRQWRRGEDGRRWSVLHPMQEWLMEQELEEGGWWNQWMWVEVGERLEGGGMREAFAAVQTRHEALRMRFKREEGRWRQRAEERADEGVCTEVDLGGLKEADQAALVTTVAEQVQRSLDVERGPVARLAILHLGGGKGDRLLVVVHHLVVDLVSWLTISEELQKGYEQRKRGEEVKLGEMKGTRYVDWCERLAEYADSEEMKREQEYWEKELGGEWAEIPVEERRGRNVEGVTETVLLEMRVEEVEEIMAEAGRAYQMRAEEVLLGAVGRVLWRWSGGRGGVKVDVEGHGREEVWAGVDVTRTVGWFTALYPVRLECGGELGEVLKHVKEQVRKVPRGGLGYGLLRYGGVGEVRERMKKLGQGAAVCFNYVGKEGGKSGKGGEGGLMRVAGESPGAARSPKGARQHEIEINAGMNAGKLWMSWGYSAERYRRATIERLVGEMERELRAIGELCRVHGGYTPSDFPLAHLSQNQLDALIGEISLRLGVHKPLIEAIYPLSPLQKGILFHSVAAPRAGIYFVQNSSMFGALRNELLHQAWETLVRRHGVLRTGFEWNHENPMQVVYREVTLPWKEEDWRGLAAREQQQRLARLLEDDREEGFELTQAPLMRIRVIRLAEDQTQVICSYHHLLLDGWSTTRLLEEARHLYEGLLQGGATVLPPPRRYADYIGWLQAQEPEAADSFWRRTLKGFTAPTRLALPHSRQKKSRGLRREVRVISSDSTAKLLNTTRRHHLTTNTFIEAAWALLLSDYSSTKDVVFGTTIACRPAELAGSETMIGLFINTLPVRVRIAPEQNVLDWLKDLQNHQVEARHYGYTPLERIQLLSEVPKGTPLFGTLLLVENYPGSVAGSGEARTSPAPATLGVFEKTNFPLALYIEPGMQIRVSLICTDPDLDDAVLRTLADHYVTLINGLVTAQQDVVRNVPRLDDSEKKKILREGNHTPAVPQPVACVHEVFEQQALKHPDAVAVECENGHLTYKEVNDRANLLAHKLSSGDIGPEKLVIVCADKSPELVIGILGVLKAGAAYVPLDPSYPPERVAHIIEDSRALAAVTKREFRSAIQQSPARIICLDADELVDPRENHQPHSRKGAAPESLIYAIYTSGSTGRPKGATVTHRGFRNLMDWYIGEFQMDAGDRPLLISSPSFDLTQKSIFAPLMLGGTLHLHSQAHFEPRAIVAEIDRAGISVITCAPTRMYELVNALDEDAPESLSSIRLVCLGGEPVDTRRLKPWAERPGFRASLINAFGPAETTDISNWHVISKEELLEGAEVSIGAALPHVATVVLDSQANLLPPGMVGEICITGRCIGRGYWGKPALTAERFIPNPYPELGSDRLYCTGDLGRRRENGEIECLGRSDHQVKIRGVRIELGEIEACLREHSSIQACAAVLDNSSGSPQVIAYVVPANGKPISVPDLRAHVRRYLPEQMMPSDFVAMAALPINAHGKLDRLALRPPQRDPLQAELQVRRAEPENEQEKRMLGIWETTLRRKPISVTDDFFDLGGNSLSALALAARIEMEFGREIPIATLLSARTVRALTPALTSIDGTSIPPLVPIQPNGSMPPLFCVHPGSGNAFCYHELATALGPEQPVFGLQDPNMNRDDYKHSSIEGLAAIYVDALRALAPQGPYNLLGWSFGGHVAYEMARRLELQGERVHVLAILDTWAVSQVRLKGTPTDSASLLEVIGRDFGLKVSKEQLEPLAPEAQIELLIELGRQAGIQYQADPRRYIRRSMRIFRARMRAMAEYNPGLYAGTIIVFRAKDDDGELPDSFDFATLGWGDLSPGRVRLHDVPGTHAMLARAPYVTVIADHLRKLFEESINSAAEEPKMAVIAASN